MFNRQKIFSGCQHAANNMWIFGTAVELAPWTRTPLFFSKLLFQWVPHFPKLYQSPNFPSGTRHFQGLVLKRLLKLYQRSIFSFEATICKVWLFLRLRLVEGSASVCFYVIIQMCDVVIIRYQLLLYERKTKSEKKGFSEIVSYVSNSRKRQQIKVGLSPSKKDCFICFSESPLKIMKNDFFSS